MECFYCGEKVQKVTEVLAIINFIIECTNRNYFLVC